MYINVNKSMYISMVNNDMDIPEQGELFFMSWRKTKSTLASADS